MAKQEIYRLGIKITVNGDGEAKKKLSAVEKMTQQMEKKAKVLEKLKINASAKVKDDASKTIDKITSRASKLNSTTITAKVKAKDEASKVIDIIAYKSDKLNKGVKTKITADGNAKKIIDDTSDKVDKLSNKKAKVKIDAEDKASKVFDKVEYKTGKFKNTSATVKIKAKDEASKTISKIETKLSSLKKSIGSGLVTGLTVGSIALGGIGLGSAVKTYADYEQVMSNVKAVSNATASEMQQLDSLAMKLGASTSFSAKESAQGIEELMKSGLTTQQVLQGGLTGALDLAAAGDLELKDAAEIASTALNAFKNDALSVSDAADILAGAANASATDVGELKYGLSMVSAVASGVGLSFKDTSTALAVFAQNGLKGSDAGTSLKTMLLNLQPSTDKQIAMFKKLGIVTKDGANKFYNASGKIKSMSEISDVLRTSLHGLNDAQRQVALETMFGTDAIRAANILYKEGAQGVNGMAAAMDKVTAKDTAAEKLNNLKGSVEELKGAVETTAIDSMKKIAPQLRQFVEWVTSKVPAIGDVIVSTFDYISKHTEELKMLATGIGAVTAALLGLSAVGKIGNAVTGVKELAGIFKGAKLAKETTTVASGLKNIGVIGKALPLIFSPVGLAIAGAVTVAGTAIAANNSLMKKSLSTTTEELTTVEKIINKLSGSTYKSKKEMQGLGLIYEDFGKNVSDDFKSMVEESTRSIREFQFFLNEINLDGEIDKTESSKFDSKIQEMMTSAVKTIEENKSKAQEGLKTMFMDNGTFSEAEKATLEYLSKSYDTQIETEKNLKEEIYNIKKRAIDEKRDLNNEDLENIKAYQNQMAQIMLESAGGNADEILFAKNKFKARAEGVDLKEGSALAQEAAKDRDSKIVDIKSKYDTYIAKLEDELANAKNETDKNNIKATIKENIKAKQEKISNVNSLYDDNLNTLFNSNSNLKGKINIYDGTELTDGDIKSQSSLDKMKERYSDMLKITESGYYGIRNSSTGAINEMYVSVDKRTGDIVGAWSATTGEIGAYTSEIKNQVKGMGDTHNSALSGAIQKLSGMGVSYDAVSGNVIRLKDGITEMIGPLENVKKAADGTATGIINLNGTPVQVTTNADGVIISLSQVSNAINNIPKEKTTTITTIFKKIIEGTNEAIGFETGIKAGASKVAQAVSKKATGTSFASRGLSTIDEQGWELSEYKSVPIIGSHGGNPLTYLSQGTKILNHMQSVQDMKKEVSHQVDTKIAEQPRQMQYQLIQAPQQPQVQVAGVGGINFGDINVNINGSNDIDNIIIQATQEFARKFRESLCNIKK